MRRLKTIDPFMLHIYAALAEKERALISAVAVALADGARQPSALCLRHHALGAKIT
jgi:hypothetical protein